MIAVIDYGAGNMRSVNNALSHVGAGYRVCACPADLAGVTGMVLPGVGHFGTAARRLAGGGLASCIVERCRDGMPLLGICLGLQLLFDGSDEAPEVSGLSMLGGRSIRLTCGRVPHMGWNRLQIVRDNALLELGDVGPFYFAHSYAVRPDQPDVSAAMVTVGDTTIPAIVGSGVCWGVQFHPEKSADTGLALLSRFCSWC